MTFWYYWMGGMGMFIGLSVSNQQHPEDSVSLFGRIFMSLIWPAVLIAGVVYYLDRQDRQEK